jgi:hypothetical protein
MDLYTGTEEYPTQDWSLDLLKKRIYKEKEAQSPFSAVSYKGESIRIYFSPQRERNPFQT